MGAAENMDEIKKTLNDIRKIADDALDSAQTAGIKGAINWGDLSVTETKFTIDEDGYCGYEVLIEEADPLNTQLVVHVRKALDRLGLSYPIQVRMEW